MNFKDLLIIKMNQKLANLNVILNLENLQKLEKIILFLNNIYTLFLK